MFRGRPLPRPDEGQPSAVEHEMEAIAGRDRRSQTAPQMLTAPGKRRIVGGGEVEAHHPEQGVQEPFGLAQREMVEESQGQSGLDGEIRVPPLPTPPAASAGRLSSGIVRLIRLDPKNLQSRTIRLQVDATRPGRRLGLV